MHTVSSYTLEYAECGSLYDYLKKNTIDFKQILMWAKEIALGKVFCNNTISREILAVIAETHFDQW